MKWKKILTSQARGICCSQTGHQLRSIVVVEGLVDGYERECVCKRKRSKGPLKLLV